MHNEALSTIINKMSFISNFTYAVQISSGSVKNEWRHSNVVSSLSQSSLKKKVHGKNEIKWSMKDEISYKNIWSLD